MTRTLFRAFAAVALAVPASGGLAQLPGAKYPPAQGTPAPFVPKNRNDRPKGPTKPKPVWEEFHLDPKATLFLDFTESSADAVLSIFSRTSGITILRDPSFKVPLTVTSAKAVSLDKAFGILNTVLGFHGYELQKRDDLLVVGKIPPPPQPAMAAPPPPPQPVIKTYPLTNANASQVARVLTEILGAAAGGNANGGNPGMASFPGGVMMAGPGGMPGGQPGGGRPASTFKATSEDYSNSVIVQAMPADQTKAEELIKQLDKKTAQALQSELFALKYVPSDQAVEAIEDLLTANSPNGRGAAKAENSRQSYYSFYDYYGGGGRSQHTAGGQSATAVKQTNSVVVNATPENMELVRQLLKNLDQPGAYTGTTFVMKLDNAKASDVADLLTKLFTQQQNNNNGGFFFLDYGGSQSQNKSALTTDVDENGQIVNVRDVVGKVNVVADPNTNSLVIQTQPGNMKMIRPIVEKLDSPVTQVMIETVIVEANLDKTDKLGVEYGTLGSVLNGSDTGSGSIDFGIASSTGLQGLKYTIGNPDYKIFLNAVASDTRFKVLDTPRIFTSNNAKAVINVGQKLPYITNTTTNALGGLVTSYTFEPVAVNLTVTPRITLNGQVTMDVVQSADDLQGYTSYNAPIINNRMAQTTVSVGDGETVVLGGIIRHTTTDSKTKVPILGDLPVLGYLFRSTTHEKGQTELLVFLTPHVVRTNGDAQRLRQSQTGELSKPSQDDLKKIVPPVGTQGRRP